MRPVIRLGLAHALWGSGPFGLRFLFFVGRSALSSMQRCAASSSVNRSRIHRSSRRRKKRHAARSRTERCYRLVAMPRGQTNLLPVFFRRLQSNASDLATERPWRLVRGLDRYDSMSTCRHDVTAFTITGRAGPSNVSSRGCVRALLPRCSSHGGHPVRFRVSFDAPSAGQLPCKGIATSRGWRCYDLVK